MIWHTTLRIYHSYHSSYNPIIKSKCISAFLFIDTKSETHTHTYETNRENIVTPLNNNGNNTNNNNSYPATFIGSHYTRHTYLLRAGFDDPIYEIIGFFWLGFCFMYIWAETCCFLGYCTVLFTLTHIQRNTATQQENTKKCRKTVKQPMNNNM